MTFKQLLERARFWVQRRHRTDELDEEIRLHLDLRVQRNLERGMTPADARTTAVRQFGDPTRVREAAAEVWISLWLDDVWQDLKFGARWLKRSPGFTAIIVATLAVGVGVNTAMFSVINSVLLQPLPYPAPDRLIWIANSDLGCSGDCFNSRADFAIWAREAPSLESAAAYGNLDVALVADGQSTAERVAFVTPELWRLSGAIPRWGRLPSAIRTSGRDLSACRIDPLVESVNRDSDDAASSQVRDLTSLDTAVDCHNTNARNRGHFGYRVRATSGLVCMDSFHRV